MIGKLALKTAKIFIRNPNLAYNDISIYQYGFFILYSNILFLFVSLLFGMLFGVLAQSIVFYLAFFSIRQFAGGYHASTETKCEIISTLSIMSCIGFCRLALTYNFNLILLIVAIICAIPILIFCPLDTPEKPLNNKEYRYFRKISICILSLIIFTVIISYHMEIHFLFSPCCMSLIMEAILIIIGKLKKVLVR